MGVSGAGGGVNNIALHHPHVTFDYIMESPSHYGTPSKEPTSGPPLPPLSDPEPKTLFESDSLAPI